MRILLRSGAFVALQIGLVVQIQAQGSFVNLDFEQAAFSVSPTPPAQPGGVIDPADAFPAWTVSATSVFYNEVSLGSPAISLMGPQFPNWPGYSPLEGDYSVLFQYFGFMDPPVLSQTAQVPESARSLTILSSAPPTVRLDNVQIPLLDIGGGRFAGDVSGFAGTQSTLTLTLTLTAAGGYYFDDIQFSDVAIPEPSSVSLLMLSVLLFGGRIWRRHGP